MVVLEIYSKCLTIKYKTYLLSKATIFTILTQIASIIAPIVIAFNSKGFWLKHDTFYEQPNVRFKGEYIFSALTDNPSSPILCNNLPFLQQFKKFDKCSLLKVIEIDKDNDGKIDELKFSLTVEIGGLKVQSFNLILILDYSLHTQCLMKMQSAAVLQYQNYYSSNEIDVNAQLGLQQFRPLFCHSRKTNQEYNFPCVPEYVRTKFEVKKVIQDYSIRNISTYLTNKYITYSTDKSKTEFLLNLRIQYPEHNFYYTVGFWQEMKWAWIQFLSLYIIFSWLRQKILIYLFDNRLFSFYEKSPLKKEK
ncbi:hypothetical protein RN001_008567 [Aquatica leii]|uniref:Transmembrane protein 231 n=1 Tax=Aquatica leii TaxID=1421715 RepID=A0AAN7PDG3_9COLE|nr:hypothetical protein RN001_008567 [Aquatica leii]